MGWMSVHVDPPYKLKEYFKDLWEEGGRYTVLDSALMNLCLLFSAVQDKKTKEVFASIELITFTPKKAGYNLAYKQLTEHAGPVYTHCPEKILDLLTPTGNDYALEWRVACRMYHKTRKEFNKEWKKVKSGDLITMHSSSPYHGLYKLVNKKERILKKGGRFVRIPKHELMEGFLIAHNLKGEAAKLMMKLESD